MELPGTHSGGSSRSSHFIPSPSPLRIIYASRQGFDSCNQWNAQCSFHVVNVGLPCGQDFQQRIHFCDRPLQKHEANKILGANQALGHISYERKKNVSLVMDPQLICVVMFWVSQSQSRSCLKIPLESNKINPRSEISILQHLIPSRPHDKGSTFIKKNRGGARQTVNPLPPSG
ncbi:hypothetical protein CDAR_235161 [Caerostris darwini]|uniref:Uncharacterized protein n=1 Tax=Caerostris darwini TaxID=1538125 RepID=A0AAV4MSI6_9ARAC|nr:hypothetical protein CDAR_235161 [Caerostris darwini]